MTSFRHDLWLLLRAPTSWVLLLAVGVLALVAPDDRPDLAAMVEEVSNTARALVLYGFSVLFAVAWGQVSEAESARHLAGASIRRQRWSQAAVHVAVVVVVLAAFATLVIARWSLAGAASGATAPETAWPGRELVYLGLTAVVVVALTTGACAGRPPSVAVPLGLALPLVHLAVYYGTDLPGHQVLQGAWPTTAAGVIARGDASEGGLGVAVLAAIAIMATVGWAVLRCDHPTALTRRTSARTAFPLPSLRREPRRSATARRVTTLLLVAVAVAGATPTVLAHQPARTRLSLWLERLDGTDPVTVAEDFTQAAQQGDVERLDRLSVDGRSAALVRALPQPIIRSRISGVFSIEESADIEHVAVLASVGGAAVHFSLQKVDGRWLVRQVVAG